MANIFKFNLKGILIVIFILIIGAGLAIYFTWISSPTEIEKEEEVTFQPTIPEDMKAGEAGEIEEGKTLAEVNPQAVASPVRPPGTPMPAAVFDTKGEIISIEEDAVRVMGSGENFEDEKARILTVKFTAETLTFEKGQKTKYLGLEGLNHLGIGQTILVSSSENIRGKTEFTVAYINKI